MKKMFYTASSVAAENKNLPFKLNIFLEISLFFEERSNDGASLQYLQVSMCFNVFFLLKVLECF